MGTKLGTIFCGQYALLCVIMHYKMAQNALFCAKKKQGALPCFIDLVEIIGIEPTTS